MGIVSPYFRFLFSVHGAKVFTIFRGCIEISKPCGVFERQTARFRPVDQREEAPSSRGQELLHGRGELPPIYGKKRFRQPFGREGHHGFAVGGFADKSPQEIDVNFGDVAGDDRANLMPGRFQAGQDPGHGTLTGNPIPDKVNDRAGRGAVFAEAFLPGMRITSAGGGSRSRSTDRQSLTGRKADQYLVEIPLDLKKDMLQESAARNGKPGLAPFHAAASAAGQDDQADRASGAQDRAAHQGYLSSSP